MKSNISIKVEFLAGTDLHEAILEAKIKARQWEVAYIKFDFNGTGFSIGRNAAIKEAEKQYQNKIKYIVCA